MTSKTHINTEKVACLRNERVVKRAALHAAMPTPPTEDEDALASEVEAAVDAAIDVEAAGDAAIDADAAGDAAFGGEVAGDAAFGGEEADEVSVDTEAVCDVTIDAEAADAVDDEAAGDDAVGAEANDDTAVDTEAADDAAINAEASDAVDAEVAGDDAFVGEAIYATAVDTEAAEDASIDAEAIEDDALGTEAAGDAAFGGEEAADEVAIDTDVEAAGDAVLPTALTFAAEVDAGAEDAFDDKAVDDADLLTGLNEDAAEEHKLDRKAFGAVAACDSFQTTAQKPIGENASTELVAVDDVLLPTAEYSCLNPGNNDVVLNGAAWARNLPGNKHLHAVCTSRKAQYIAIHQRDTKSKHNYICATIEFVENNGFRFLQSTPDGFQLAKFCQVKTAIQRKFLRLHNQRPKCTRPCEAGLKVIWSSGPYRIEKGIQ